MPTLYGRKYGREELLQHVGDISQIARAKPYRLVEGHEDGLLAVDVTTGSGFGFTVVPGKGMDVSAASYNGRSLAWRSAVGDRHAAFFEPHGTGWLRSFAGGLVTTCGLTWMGAACVDEGKPLGLHGRASHLPATEAHWGGEWEGDDYVLTVSGKLREAIVFGENVSLTRRIRAKLGESRFTIEDRVDNLGYERTPHMLLYHINLGFPVIAEGSRLIAPSISVQPRDAVAESGFDRFQRMQAPTRGYAEQCFFHQLRAGEDGRVTAAVVNPECDEGLGVYVTFNKNELPFFTEWKMMSQGTYVLGMEPANALVLGRAEERKAGRLQFLESGEIRIYRLEIGVVEGREAIAALEKV